MSVLDTFRFARREVRGVTRGTRDRADDPTRAIVVGGGLAGVSAACVLAERGVTVTLLEQAPYLGGRLGAWTEQLPDGTPYQMGRGFHAFFRQYYNLRNLFRRIDPELERFRALDDYPILGPDGTVESFAGLPVTPPLNLMALLRRTKMISLQELRAVDQATARRMLMFDMTRTYAEHDNATAAGYLDGLGMPERGHQLLFDVLSHSCFDLESETSAAEMLMRLHFYFLGNPEGMVFDVLDEPCSDGLWKPMERYLTARGVEIRLGCAVERVEQVRGGSWIAYGGGAEVARGEALVLAVTVSALQSIVERSPDLQLDGSLFRAIERLDVTRPSGVWRLFLDRPAGDERPSFAGTAGMGPLDRIILYDRLEGESRRWALRTGGSVVELHAHACPTDDEEEIRASMLDALHQLYPELAMAEIVHDTWQFRRDAPSFAPGSHAQRPRVATPYGSVVLAGDFVRLPFPCALMERAVSSGMLAANHLLDRWDVRGESLFSVPQKGFIASFPLS